MDFQRPVQAIIPGAQGRILAVLAQTSAELNLRTIARLSGVSTAQASRVMPGLVELGIVERRDAPPSVLFAFVPDHVAARAVTAIADARRAALGELRETAGRLSPAPDSVIVFGSFARGDADRESDLDILLVRPTHIDDADASWRAAVDEWRDHARRYTGNRVEILEVERSKISAKLRSRAPLWRDIARDGVVIRGQTLDELRGRRGA